MTGFENLSFTFYKTILTCLHAFAVYQLENIQVTFHTHLCYPLHT